jgi:hypothetical protein
VNIYKPWIPQKWRVSSQAISCSRKILHPGAIYNAATKKFPWTEGIMTLEASSILPIILLPTPLICQPAEGVCH